MQSGCTAEMPCAEQARGEGTMPRRGGEGIRRGGEVRRGGEGRLSRAPSPSLGRRASDGKPQYTVMLLM